jgi:hypothetical protein
MWTPLRSVRPPRTPHRIAFDGIVVTVWHVRDERLRKRLWAALERDNSTRGQTWKFKIGRLAKNYHDRDFASDLINRVFGPHEAIPWLERCVAVGTLTRSEANAAMESILAQTNAAGKWR